MELEFFVDRSGYVHCPRCKESNLRYELIPSPRLEAGAEADKLTIHFDDVRDYRCVNCDATWLMSDSDCGKEF